MNFVFGCFLNSRSRSAVELLETRELGGRIPAIRKQRQLEPALVLAVDGLEELRRIGRVDEDCQIQTRASIPNRVKLRIVDVQARTIGLANTQAEPFHDLANAHRPGLDVGLELLHGLRRPTGPHALKIEARQNSHAVPIGRGPDKVERSLQTLARHVVGADDDPDIEAVERRPESREAFRGIEKRSGMAVIVNRRELRFRHRMLWRDQGRMRPVVDDRRRRKLGRLAEARTHFRGPGWTFLSSLDLHGIAAPSASTATRRALRAWGVWLGRCAGGRRLLRREDRSKRDAERGHDETGIHASGALLCSNATISLGG